MSTTAGLHICKQTPDAPSDEGDYELGTRWVCECGGNFVFREGLNRRGYPDNAWWPAPALPRQRRHVRDMLFGPRRGS
jgi:hypothetical protein